MIIGASKELKEIVIESGHMAESLFERVNDGYHELTVSKKYMTNCSPKIIKYHITQCTPSIFNQDQKFHGLF